MHAHTLPRGARPGAGANAHTRPLDTVNAERFWSCVDVGGEDDCWLWLCGKSGQTTTGSYGTYYDLGRTLSAHRVAFYLHHGRWPEQGKQVRHLCGTNLCCNPLHLAEGTQADNERDKAIHGRNRGNDHVQVVAAIERGLGTAELAELFDVHPGTARRWLAQYRR